MLVSLLATASLSSCVTPGYPGGVGYSSVTVGQGGYSTLPRNYSGSSYYLNGRYYSGGRYESGTFHDHGRTYTNRYYSDGRYYYGGRHEQHAGPSSRSGFDRHNDRDNDRNNDRYNDRSNDRDRGRSSSYQRSSIQVPTPLGNRPQSRF